MVQRRHLVQNAAEGPYIRLVVVGLIVEEFRGHVVRRPDPRAGKVHRAFQYLRRVPISSGKAFFI